MRGSRLWFIVPVVALSELAAHLWISVRAPDPTEWAAIAGPVRRLATATPGTALVVAPSWAEPLARHVLRDELWPIADLARPNDSGVRQVVEISLLGAIHPATATWPVERQLSQGPFHFTSRKNPHYEPALFSLVDAIMRAEPTVFRRINATRYPCTWRQNLPPSTGGLHGHVAFPRERYLCGRSQDEFVGITLIDDERFEPRQCVWVQAPREGEQWLSIDNVPLGRKLDLHAGSSYFVTRDGTSAPITIEVLVDGSPTGKAHYRDPQGWVHFAFDTPKSAGQPGRLELKISSEQAGGRSVCLAAETR